MMKRAWVKASAFACCAVIATACVVSTNDGTDPDPEDLDTGGTGSGSGGSDSTGGTTSAEGGTTAEAGTGNNAAGAAGDTGTSGTCEVTMPAACAECLGSADNGFSTDDDSGLWDACDGNYPCCEESSRYVLCMQVAWSGEEICEDQGYGDDYTSCCADTVAAGLEVDALELSEAFYALTAEAFSEEAEPSCFSACFF